MSNALDSAAVVVAPCPAFELVAVFCVGAGGGAGTGRQVGVCGSVPHPTLLVVPGMQGRLSTADGGGGGGVFCGLSHPLAPQYFGLSVPPAGAGTGFATLTAAFMFAIALAVELMLDSVDGGGLTTGGGGGGGTTTGAGGVGVAVPSAYAGPAPTAKLLSSTAAVIAT